jgi:hypothetical protein
MVGEVASWHYLGEVMTMLNFRSLGKAVIVTGLTVAALIACVSSHVMIGKARAPISPDQVQIYMRPPMAKYDEIAFLDTSSRDSFSFTAQGKSDKVIERLKKEAAKIGANGILLQGISDQVGGSIGTGVGSSNYSQNSAVGVGLGGSVATHQKAGNGVAIYVYPDPKAQQ